VRTVLLTNNRLGARIAAFLRDRGDLAALVLHPEERRTHGDAFAAIDAPAYTWPDGFDALSELAPECVLSVLFAYRVPPEWLALAQWRAVNLHPGLLPYNKGAAPNAWPLVDGTPAGTTLHVMEATIDTGAIFAQREVSVGAYDTAATLYERLESASHELFTEVWPGIRDLEPTPQAPGGTAHRLADLAQLDLTEADFPTLDRLRARTIGPFGAEFERDGRRYRARIEIEEVGDDSAETRGQRSVESTRNGID
jgi:methionyl-tRNA formyltransferase